MYIDYIDIATAGSRPHYRRYVTPHQYFLVFAHDRIMLSALYAIARPSVCLSVTRLDRSVKTIEVRIMQFLLYGK